MSGDDPHDARAVAVDIVRKLVAEGHEAYFAGGCVRDRLMGHEPKDYDVATDARPDEIRRVFPRAHGVGVAFGVHLVRRHGHVVEVATFRSDGRYSDGRHPDDVTFADAESDARRRDFTINGLFEDPLTGRVIDFVDGRADLEAGMVRAIGDAKARLHEDRLRMLRAIRFAARFGFSIDVDTAEAIRADAESLRAVSRERIGQEVRWMFEHPNRGVAAWEMQYLGLDAVVLEDAPSIKAPMRVGRLPDDAPYPTALAAWMLDRSDRAVLGSKRARAWRSALMLSNDETEGLADTLEIHRTLRTEWSKLGVAGQKRLASSSWFDSALMIIGTEDAQAFVELRRRVLQLAETGLAPEPIVRGEDLIGLGLRPGPMFRTILDQVYDAQLEGAIADREAGLWLVEMLVRTNEGDDED